MSGPEYEKFCLKGYEEMGRDLKALGLTKK